MILGRSRAPERLGASVALPISVSRVRRAGTVVLGAVALALGVGSVIAVLALLSDQNSIVLHPMSTTLAAFFVAYVSLRFGWIRARPSFARRPQVRVERGFFVVDHSGLFRKPLRIPWADIEAIAVDDGIEEPARSSKRQRFYLTSEAVPSYGPAALPRWLYSPHQGSPFPLLSHVTDTPNVAVLMRSPKALEDVRTTRPLGAASATHFPVPKARARGLLLRLRNPEALRTSAQPHADVRPITLDDIVNVEPSTHEHRAARRKIYAARVAMALVIVASGMAPNVAMSGVYRRPEYVDSHAAPGPAPCSLLWNESKSSASDPNDRGLPSRSRARGLRPRCDDSASSGRARVRRT